MEAVAWFEKNIYQYKSDVDKIVTSMLKGRGTEHAEDLSQDVFVTLLKKFREQLHQRARDGAEDLPALQERLRAAQQEQQDVTVALLDLWIGHWKSQSGLDEKQTKNFIFKIATNAALGYLRKTRARARRQPTDGSPEALPDTGSNPLDTLITSETDQRRLHSLSECLTRLHPKEELCVRLRFYDGLPDERIAGEVRVVLGRPIDQGKIRYIRASALRKLRRCLERKLPDYFTEHRRTARGIYGEA